MPLPPDKNRYCNSPSSTEDFLAQLTTAPVSDTTPTLSIVTPSFNQADFLGSTISSVVEQNYPKLEYVVVDGSSTDRSNEILQQSSDRLHWWVSEEDSGPEEAINKGFSRTSGEIMAWIGASDMYLPWTFSLVASLFERFPKVQWLTTLFPLQLDESSRITGLHELPPYYPKGFFRGEYLSVGGQWRPRGWIQAESTFWRRSLWEKAGGQLDTSQHASDFDLWARFFKHAKLWGVASPLAGWRLEENQRGHGNEATYHESSLSVLNRYGHSPTEPEDSDLSPRLPEKAHDLLVGAGVFPSGPILLFDEEKGDWKKQQFPIRGTYHEASPALFGLGEIGEKKLHGAV
ncbi:MAG: glycosyltransferase family 2 protein [Verrucomicrobiales bacterium]|nr:glycosyltransferase family 2 protein [Verrucomicrobiales bacterium]